MKNSGISIKLNQVAHLLQIRGDSIHRVLSYRRAAESIAELTQDINLLAKNGELRSIPGIGNTLEEKINELLSTGRLLNSIGRSTSPDLT